MTDKNHNKENRVHGIRPSVHKIWYKERVEEDHRIEELMCHLGFHEWAYEEEENTANRKRYCTECHRIESVEGI